MLRCLVTKIRSRGIDLFTCRLVICTTTYMIKNWREGRRCQYRYCNNLDVGMKLIFMHAYMSRRIRSAKAHIEHPQQLQPSLLRGSCQKKLFNRRFCFFSASSRAHLPTVASSLQAAANPRPVLQICLHVRRSVLLLFAVNPHEGRQPVTCPESLPKEATSFKSM